MGPIQGFQWAEARVPLNVVVMRETYATGNEEGWALPTTGDTADRQQPLPDSRHRYRQLEENSP